ncbi:MAG: DUF3313 domain-containing protein [Candidatus Methylumidiphilus sp.]
MCLISQHKQLSFQIIIMLFALSLSGCGAKESRRMEQSGFLGDYSQMKEGTNNEALFVEVNPKADCRNYPKVIIDEATLWAKTDDSPLSKLDPKDQKMLVTLGWGTVYDGMQKAGFEIVDTPGPGVMRVRGAITEAVKARVLVANAMALAPYVWEATTLWGMGTGKWPFLGELAGEMEVVDSQSGERLFAAMSKVVGTLGSTLNPTARWGDVHDGFDRWRENIAKRMTSCRATGSFAMPEDDRSWIRKQVEYWSP